MSVRRLSRLLLPLALAVPLVAMAGGAGYEGPRVLKEGELPKDVRLGKPKDLNGYFPMTVPASKEAWDARAAELRRQVLVSQGLWPLPKKTPANAVVHGRVERDDYTVDRVFFESWPGHFVTGSLYRPKGKTGPFPAVLCPHGHWNNGRFQEWNESQIKNEIVQGAERFALGGKYPLQSRCVTLARMGCVVFHYDMIGYADSIQLQHRTGAREHMNGAENWGFFSPQAEQWQETIMGLQTYNSIRALDFITEQPDVDASRIGVTGASGGGTQTFILCAVDPRPTAAVPAVMVSTGMQGGCTCENCSYLRVGTGNIELAGLFAPKPMGLLSADDWTKEIPTKGFPELQQLYKLIGAPDNVASKPLIHFTHNYNYVSRAFMYGFFNQHLKLGLTPPVIEEEFLPLSIEEMSVWDASHTKPLSGDDYERSLLRTMTAESVRQLTELEPTDDASFARYKEVVGGGWEVLVGRSLPAKGTVTWEPYTKNDGGDHLEILGMLRHPGQAADPTLTDQKEEIPALFLFPKNWNKQVVIWVDEKGKAGLYDTDGLPRAEVRKLVAGGTAVAGIDTFLTGEFLADADAKNSLVQVYQGEWAKSPCYTFGYNHSAFARRVHDVLSAISFCKHFDHHGLPEKIHLAGINGSGPIVAAAAAIAGDAVDRVAINTGGFRFASVTAIDDANFVPGACKYGDVPGLLKLAARGHEVWLGGESVEVSVTVGRLMRPGANNFILAPQQTIDRNQLADWLGRK